jgi:hypothetical protein
VYAALVGSLHLAHMNINLAALPRGGPVHPGPMPPSAPLRHQPLPRRQPPLLGLRPRGQQRPLLQKGLPPYSTHWKVGKAGAWDATLPEAPPFPRYRPVTRAGRMTSAPSAIPQSGRTGVNRACLCHFVCLGESHGGPGVGYGLSPLVLAA